MAAVPPARAVFRFLDLPWVVRREVYLQLPAPILNVGGPNDGRLQVVQFVAVSRQTSTEFSFYRPATRVTAIFWCLSTLGAQHNIAGIPQRWRVVPAAQRWRVVTAVVRGAHLRLEPVPLQLGVYHLTDLNARAFEACFRAAMLFPNLTQLVMKVPTVTGGDLGSVTWAIQQQTPFAVRVEMGSCPSHCRRCSQTPRGGNVFDQHTLPELIYQGAWERQANQLAWVRV